MCTLISIKPSDFLLIVQPSTSGQLTLILPLLQYANDAMIMDIGSATYPEIQKECTRLGLRAVGRRSVLVRRLMSSSSYQQNSLTLQSREDKEFQPSHVHRAEIHEGGMQELDTSSLVQVMQGCRGDLEGEISDWLVERRRGPRVDLDTLMESAFKALAIIGEESESQAKELAELDLRLDSLEESVAKMKASTGTYRELRSRFLSTFKRDKLGTATKADLSIAGEGTVPEGGDAAIDAMLYEGTRGRRDFITFRKLYGLEPETVLKIRKSSCYL